VNRLVYQAVRELGSSISAEHGLGQLKRETIREYKDPLELELMRSIEQTPDPHGLMNPGNVLAPTTINQCEAKRRHTWQLNLK